MSYFAALRRHAAFRSAIFYIRLYVLLRRRKIRRRSVQESDERWSRQNKELMTVPYAEDSAVDGIFLRWLRNGVAKRLTSKMKL
jgi:hypothetical protein